MGLTLTMVITAATHDWYAPVGNILELVLTFPTGNVYIMKGTSFMKSKKFLGMCVDFQVLVFRLIHLCSQTWFLRPPQRKRRNGEGRLGRRWQRVCHDSGSLAS